MNRIARYVFLVLVIGVGGYYVIRKFVIHHDSAPLHQPVLGPVGSNDTGGGYRAVARETTIARDTLDPMNDIALRRTTRTTAARDDTVTEIKALRERVAGIMEELARTERELQLAEARQRELRQSLDRAQTQLGDAQREVSFVRASEQTARKQAELLDQQRAQMKQQHALLEQELAKLRVQVLQANQQRAASVNVAEPSTLSRPALAAKIDKVGLPARVSIPLILFRTSTGLTNANETVKAIAVNLRENQTAWVRIELPDAPSIAITLAAPGDAETAHTKAARYLRDQLIANGVPSSRIRFTERRVGGFLGVRPMNASTRDRESIDLVIER